MHHVVEGIELDGPPWYHRCYAMRAFEQLWGRLIDQNQATKHAATSIMLNNRAQHLAMAVKAMTGRDDRPTKPRQAIIYAIIYDSQVSYML